MPESKRARVVLLPGDGIGPEVLAEAAKVLLEVTRQAEIRLELEERPVGGAAIESASEPLPRPTFEAARSARAVLLGAVGSPRHDSLPREKRPERALLELRRTRDNKTCTAALKALTAAARTRPGEANLMEKILDCARSYATEGEIRNAMREVFGDYVESAEF